MLKGNRDMEKFLLFKLLFSVSSIQAMLERQFTQLQTKFHKLINHQHNNNNKNIKSLQQQKNHIQRSIKKPKIKKKKYTFFFTS